MKNINREIGNLRLTKQRQVILTVIRDAKEHLTANEVFEKAIKMLPKISFATVYNSLRFLREAGHIAEISFGNGASRFDRMTERHDHAICSACGRLVDIHLDMPEELVSRAVEFSKFEPESLEFTLRGLCPECK